MSLQGLQNYTQPLTLLGNVTINGDFNTKNVYVTGQVTGAGISTNILATDNTWTGTNDFRDITSYTGIDGAIDNDMLTKGDIDDAVLGYNPLPQNQTWSLSPTFSNANPPVLPTAGATAPSTILTGYNDMISVIGASPIDLTKNATNLWSGTNTFTNFVGVSVGSPLLLPSDPQNPVSKTYIDGKIEVAGKALTYVITTPGTYNFANANIANIGKIEYWLFSGSCGGSSGAVVSGTIGNGCGLNGSLLLTIGTTADPATSYTSQDASLPSSTQFLVSNQVVGSAFGACNLNGVITAGIKGNTTYGSIMGLSANGRVGDNILSYSNVLGTSTSGGGCVFIAYYL